MTTSLVRVLIHAANGVGLGHVARMSIFAEALRDRLGARLSLSYFSTCSNAREFLGDSGRVLWCKSPAEPQALAAYAECIELVKPDILICDTWWPRGEVQAARRQGARTALVSRLIGPSLAPRVYEEALQDFDTIVLCTTLDEAKHFYPRSHAAHKLLVEPRIRLGGRVGRIAPLSISNERTVLFSLGGGGDYHKSAGRDTVQSLIRQCQIASEELTQAGYKCFVTQGPLMKPVPPGAWTILETMRAHEHMSAQTIVVSRPGNLTPSEALAAGARLVLVGIPQHDDEIVLRAGFLDRTGLALIPNPGNRHTLAQTIVAEFQKGWDPLDIRTRAAVNAGLAEAITHILGGFA